MSINHKLSDLRNRAIGDLVAAHDYYSDVKYALEIVRIDVEDGLAFSKFNDVTGTTTMAPDFAAKATNYVNREVAEATFLQFLSIFESYIFDLIRIWLIEHPLGMTKKEDGNNKQIDVKVVLDSPDKAAIVEYMVTREVNQILYEAPAKWFGYLEVRAKLGAPSPSEIEKVSEAKAIRDLLAHNRGMVNETYLRKSGTLAQFKLGDRIAVSPQYHREIWELLKKIVDETSMAALLKTSAPSSS